MSTLTGTGIAVLVASQLMLAYNQIRVNEYIKSKGEILGQQADVLGAAVDAYSSVNFRSIVGQTDGNGNSIGIVNEDGTAGTSPANKLRPTVAELRSLGFLKQNFSSSNGYGGWRVDLSTVGTCPWSCTISGTISTAAGVQRNGQVDFKALASAMRAVGADSGISKPASPASITGQDNLWGPIANPVGSVAGVFAIRVGTDATRFNSAYMRDGRFGLTAPMKMGNQYITGLQTVTAGTTVCTNKGDIARDLSTGAPVYCPSNGGTYSAIGGSTSANWVANYASLPTCNAANDGKIYGVATPTTGSGARGYICNSGTWNALGVDDSGNLTVPNRLIANGATIGTGSNSNGSNNNSLILGNTANVGDPCGNVGALAKDSTGAILSCQNSVWERQGSVYAWGRFNGTACTPLCPVYGSSGVSTIQRTSTGRYTVNFTRPPNDVAYSVISSSIPSRPTGAYIYSDRFEIMVVNVNDIILDTDSIAFTVLR